jgi:hypothetical protein
LPFSGLECYSLAWLRANTFRAAQSPGGSFVALNSP